MGKGTSLFEYQHLSREEFEQLQELATQKSDKKDSVRA